MDWRPSCMLTDASQAQIGAARDVWGGDFPVLLCQWHVTQAWTRNYSKARKSHKALGAALKKLMHECSPRGHDMKAREQAAIEAIQQTWQSLGTAPAWNQYFKDQWIEACPPSMWMTALRAHIRYGPNNTTSSIESFHKQLKTQMKFDVLRAPRVDELFYHLGRAASNVGIYRRLGSIKRAANHKQAAAVTASIEAASLIPSEHVHPPSNGARHWTVESSETPGQVYEVNPLDALGCTCLQVNRRVTCKHIIKVLKTKEPDLSDDLIVEHLGKAWGTEYGTVEDPPEYRELVRQLVQLKQDYPDWQGKAAD
ncbi:hypothetical protein QBZ16_002284 [Prototheca wickerhamii]|uniref:SWIM-type domain-containing protein n=1 Tax=Prototheca wickerhamii TaxID=3111 RepID=A0AAD9MIB2_PROWI|nr:hypothetical protein QBZ16_002284 [Prototheca wickerhamii]